jgi:hypothetical protein
MKITKCSKGSFLVDFDAPTLDLGRAKKMTQAIASAARSTISTGSEKMNVFSRRLQAAGKAFKTA